jgi:hypothetical protein
MTMTVSAESAAAKAAVLNAAIVEQLPVRAQPSLRTAVAPHEPHRHGTDGRSAHQRQHNAPRTFHGFTLGSAFEAMAVLRHSRREGASESASFHGIVRHEISPAISRRRKNAT